MLRFLFSLVCGWLVALSSFAQADDSSYQSGTEMAAAHPDLVRDESGFYVSVPVDYKNPLRGQTKIYVHFQKPFRANLPTFAFFNGGPGQASHFPNVRSWKSLSDLRTLLRNSVRHHVRPFFPAAH